MSDEGEKSCPLCAEEMDLTDQQLKPCKCGYEICVWCWHHIMDMAEKDDTEGRCPACRTPYDKEKIVGMAASCERLVAEINLERKKSQKAKPKSHEGRKQLSSVRVIQRNLVYIVGLPLNLADEDLLQSREYFGQYGKVLKVSMSRTAAGVIQQFPNNTCSVYITFSTEEEAIRCIQSVHGFLLDGRSLKACFGTTKYCHAWLRNVPCTNPDCLYLHEIGSQEDSFTKDEIISAYTRVQQITSGTNNMPRRSGNMLPPPIDDYCNNNSSTASKPIVKNASNSTSADRGSPPNGSSGCRSAALPPAASWGMRTSNQPQAASSTCSNGPTKPKSDPVSGTLAFSSAVTSTTQSSTLHSDVGKKSFWNEESQTINDKGTAESSLSVKQQAGVDHRATVLERAAMNDVTSPGMLSNPSLSPRASKYTDSATTLVPNVANSIVHAGQSTGPEEQGITATDEKIQNLSFDKPLTRAENFRSEPAAVVRTSGSLLDHSTTKLPGSRGLQQQFAEQYSEPLTSLVTNRTATSVNEICVSREQFDWSTDPETPVVTKTVSEVEEDVISFDNQRLKDPEVVNFTTYLPNSANSLHISNQSRSHSSQHNLSFSAVNSNSDPLFVDDRVGDRSLLHTSTNSMMSNGFHEKLISSSSGSDRHLKHSLLPSFKGEGMPMGRLHVDSDGNATLDGGESSIISDILSLDLDSWDKSLTSAQDLAKFLGENDIPPSALKMSSSWKAQNNNESRFSFARREESGHQTVDIDPSFSIFGQLQKNSSFSQDFAEKRNSYSDKFEIGNGFSSGNFEELEAFSGNHSVLSSNKPPVSRTQISAPPGFSVPSRAPPPGFSSHKRMDQTFDTIAGNHLLNSSLMSNSYQAPPPGNIGSTGDIEFMDPAILAVGKGRVPGGLNGSGLDMRSNFPQRINALEHESRLQLPMQRSLSPHQNLRYDADMGDSFSSLGDSYGISSRLVDHSQVSNLSPFAHLPLQRSRNGLTSNGHWDGWNEMQGRNSLGVAELLRNERLGFNKFYTAGYEDSKFRMASSGDLYYRTFEM